MIPDQIAALMTLVYPDWRDLDNNEPLDKEAFRDVRAAAIRIHEAGYCRLNDAVKVIEAVECPFKDGDHADGWAEAWATFLNRLGNPVGTSSK